MFRNNKAIKEYKNSIDKIKIPNLKGEEYISVKHKKEIKILSIMRRSTVALAIICGFVLFTFMSSAKVMNNDFSIKAYAGTNTIDLESGKIVELPSGWVDGDTYTMQGLLIESNNIERIALQVDNGKIDYIRTNSYYAGKQVLYFAPNGGGASGRSGYSGLVTAKFISQEIMDKISNCKEGENIEDDEEVRKALNLPKSGENEDKYPNEDKSSNSHQFSGYTEIENDEDWKNHYILWIPDMQFLKDISEGKEIDYSTVEDANIKFTITFKDNSEVTKNLHLSFNEKGNLNCELN